MVGNDLVRIQLTPEQADALAPILERQAKGDGYTVLVLTSGWDAEFKRRVITAHCRWLSRRQTDLLAKQMMKTK